MTKPHLNHCRQLAELPEEVAVGDLTAISLAAGKGGGACAGALVAAPV